MTSHQPRKTWLWIRSLLYSVLVGGVWLIVLPAGLLHYDPAVTVIRLRTWDLAFPGLLLLVFGWCLSLWAAAHLVRDGRGTPFPLDRTRNLVTTGPYAFVRNPQGIALVLLTVGEALAVDSSMLWLLPLLAIVFLLVLAQPFEDHELPRRFGRAYELYQTEVPRWFPRPRQSERPRTGP
ncbi:MAG TPA: isoprenylcysteine carboxylmethyltransferase family protein [Gemmatimonadales bacterium]|nr:isoprenylcysteine carboxylmethyltransferase family protein [Gemmatimonadales bacterium]